MAGPARGGCLVFCRMLPESRSYEDLGPRVPLAECPLSSTSASRSATAGRSAIPASLRLIAVGADGRARDVSYGWLRETSNRLANALAANGVKRGDRVAILLPQAPEVAAIHIAIYKLGAIALPLAVLFGTDAIAYRLQNAGAKARHHQRPGVGEACRDRRTQGDALAGLTLVLSIDGPGDGALGFARDAVARLVRISRRSPTAADDPAMMIYTSGTTGQPKGALHAHRVLIGHMPGIELPHEFFPQPGDRFWTPADWAWAGGLLDCLLPSLYCGVPVVAQALRQVRSGGGLRGDGAPSACATRSSRRPRCACCARCRTRAAATTSRCARSAPAARRSAPRPSNGARPRSASRSTSSTARPNAISWSARAPASAWCGPAPSARRSPATPSR